MILASILACGGAAISSSASPEGQPASAPTDAPLAAPTSAPVASPTAAPAGVPSPLLSPGVPSGDPAMGVLDGPCEASAMIPWSGGFLVGDNETDDRLFLFSNDMAATGTVPLSAEVSDIEALAGAEGALWVVGSHSRNKSGEYKKKRHRLLRQPGGLVEPDLSGCAACVAAEPLAPNDGGLDIEGAAVVGGHLWLGLRAPLIGGRAILLDLGAEGKAVERQLEIDLGGRGVRELMADGEGFLVLAGPVADAEVSHALYAVARPGEPALALGITLPTSSEGLARRGTDLVYVTDGDGKNGQCATVSRWGVLVGAGSASVGPP